MARVERRGDYRGERVAVAEPRKTFATELDLGLAKLRARMLQDTAFLRWSSNQSGERPVCPDCGQELLRQDEAFPKRSAGTPVWGLPRLRLNQLELLPGS